MVREKLETVTAEDDAYHHIFPEAVDELEPKLSGKQFVAMLEKVDRTQHDVFLLSADWNTRSMVD